MMLVSVTVPPLLCSLSFSFKAPGPLVAPRLIGSNNKTSRIQYFIQATMNPHIRTRGKDIRLDSRPETMLQPKHTVVVLHCMGILGYCCQIQYRTLTDSGHLPFRTRTGTKRT